MRASIILAAAISTLAHITPAFTAVCSKGKYFDKVLTIILENEDASSAFSDPYLGTTLAAQGYALTNMLGTTHPSQPNYISMIGGDILGVTSNSNKDLAQTNLVDLLESKGLTWKTYQENYPGGCATAASYSNGLYRRKHNPFISFTTISQNPARCSKIVSSSQLDADIVAGNLPDYMFYTPNMDNDGHDTSVGYASNWLKGFLKNKLGNPLWQNTLILVTFDESDTASPNLIYGLLLGAGIKGKGLKDSTKYTHYSWLATIEDNYSLGNLGRKDATATKMPLISGGCGSGTSITTAIPTPPSLSTTLPIPTVTPCAHSICATGVALKAACDPCAAKIIAADSYCGTTSWDSTCVGEVKSVCGLTTCA